MGPDRDQSMPLLVVADNESQLGVPSGAALVVHLPGVRRQQATSIVVVVCPLISVALQVPRKDALPTATDSVQFRTIQRQERWSV